MWRVVLPFMVGVAVGASFFNIGIKSRLEPQVLADKIVAESTAPNVSPTPTDSPTPVPTGTPTPKPTILPTPETTSTPKPTPTPVPQPTFTSEQIYGFTERFGAQYLVDPNVLRHIALCESGFNPLAKNGSYYGLYQFGPITWKGYRLGLGEDPNPDLRLNAEEAVQTAAYALSLGKSHIWPNCAP